jgi:hypothetical protein
MMTNKTDYETIMEILRNRPQTRPPMTDVEFSQFLDQQTALGIEVGDVEDADTADSDYDDDFTEADDARLNHCYAVAKLLNIYANQKARTLGLVQPVVVKPFITHDADEITIDVAGLDFGPRIPYRNFDEAAREINWWLKGVVEGYAYEACFRKMQDALEAKLASLA